MMDGDRGLVAGLALALALAACHPAAAPVSATQSSSPERPSGPVAGDRPCQRVDPVAEWRREWERELAPQCLDGVKRDADTEQACRAMRSAEPPLRLYGAVMVFQCGSDANVPTSADEGPQPRQ